jgi:hypothetical protein
MTSKVKYDVTKDDDVIIKEFFKLNYGNMTSKKVVMSKKMISLQLLTSQKRVTVKKEVMTSK